MNFTETEEQQALRKTVAELGKRYGHDYAAPRARAREPLTELWSEAGKSGFLGLNLPEQYGGGGAGMYELALVGEELNAAGCGLLMMVVSPAINRRFRLGAEASAEQAPDGCRQGLPSRCAAASSWRSSRSGTRNVTMHELTAYERIWRSQSPL